MKASPFKYELGQKVWVLRNLKAVQVKLTAMRCWVRLRKSGKAEEEKVEVSYTLEWPKEKGHLHGYHDEFESERVFATKEDLVKHISQ